MKTHIEGLDRREFLKQASRAVATVTASSAMAIAAAPEEKPTSQSEIIPSRTLGKTGLKLPLLASEDKTTPTHNSND